jgi:hypothetical protein
MFCFMYKRLERVLGFDALHTMHCHTFPYATGNVWPQEALIACKTLHHHIPFLRHASACHLCSLHIISWLPVVLDTQHRAVWRPNGTHNTHEPKCNVQSTYKFALYIPIVFIIHYPAHNVATCSAILRLQQIQCHMQIRHLLDICKTIKCHVPCSYVLFHVQKTWTRVGLWCPAHNALSHISLRNR